MPDSALPPSVPTTAWPVSSSAPASAAELARGRPKSPARTSTIATIAAAGLAQRSGGAIGAVIVGEDDDLLAGSTPYSLA